MAASDITAKPASGQGTQTIAITVPANTGNKRTYTLTATTASGKTATLTVVQEAAAVTSTHIVLQYTGTTIPSSYVGKTVFVNDGKDTAGYYTKYGKIAWISSSKIEIDVSDYTKSDIQGIYEDLSWGDLCKYDELYFGISSNDNPKSSWTPIFTCTDKGTQKTVSDNLANALNSSYNGAEYDPISCISLIKTPSVTHKTLKLKGGAFCVGNPDDIIDSISGKNLIFTLTDGGNSSNAVSFTCSSYEITISENSGTEIYWEDYDNVQAFYRTMSGNAFSLGVTDDDGNAIVNAPAINKDALEVFAGDFDSHDTPIVFEFGKKHVSFEGTLYVNADQYISSYGLIGVFLNCTSGNRYFVKALEYNYGAQDSLNLFEQGSIIEIDSDDIPESLEFAVTDDASMSDVENIDNYTTTVSYIQPNNDEATVKVTTLEGVTIIEGYTVSYDSCMKFSEVMYCPDMSRIEFSGQDESDYYFWFY